MVDILWTSEVETKVCTMSTPQSRHVSRSDFMTLASPHTWRSSPASTLFFTDAFSPSDDIGKPASMISTPRLSSCRAMRSCSSNVSDTPGVCSPSRSVVSKILIFLFLTDSMAVSYTHLRAHETRHDLVCRLLL